MEEAAAQLRAEGRSLREVAWRVGVDRKTLVRHMDVVGLEHHRFPLYRPSEAHSPWHKH